MIERFYTKTPSGYEHSFLSNFYVGESISMEPHFSVTAKTAEHAYQAMKCVDRDECGYVLAAPTPGVAKKRGRSVQLVSDWEAIKIPAMKFILNQKFLPDDSELSKKLLDTGDNMLVEGNDWGDTFWGMSNGKGQNWLGILLMARRAELRGAGFSGS